jgi:hypothetical protein
MSRSDWYWELAYFGVVGIALILAVAGDGLLKQHYQAQHAYEATREKHERSKQIEIEALAAKGQSPDEKSRREEWRAEDDLVAQQDMARWAWWSMWATVFGVVLLALTLRETIKATRAATKAAVATERAVETQVRLEGPILHIQKIESPGTRPIWVALKNAGKSPAFVYEETMGFLEGRMDFPEAPQGSRVSRFDGEVWSPGDVRHLATRWNQPEEAFRVLPIIIFGTVTYKNVFGQQREMGFGARAIASLELPNEPISVIWEQAGGDQYNYDRSIDAEA